MDARIFLDEFRPFRRGEIALARRVHVEPDFLPRRELDRLRSILRLAQLSSIGPEPDALVDRIGSERLRMLQLLAPVLPVQPDQIEAPALLARLPKVTALAEQARRRIVDAGIAGEAEIDGVLADKRVVLVLGGAAGSGYVFLGALDRLAALGITPSYLTGCSVGAILAVIRARSKDFDLPELYEDVHRLREGGVFRAPNTARFGVPAALRLDLHGTLGELFTDGDGRDLRMSDLAIPTDVLSTGVGAGALTEPREAYAHMIDAELQSAAGLAKLPPSGIARWTGALVSLAMSRQMLVPVFLGADPATRQLPALDAAGFSASIPALLQYDLSPGDEESAAILAEVFERHALVGLIDGALASLIPARYTWDAIESGRIGTRNTLVLALDAIANARGSNRLMSPILRLISASADRDKAFWDLHVNFRNAPPFLDLFPTNARLEKAAASGAKQFEPTEATLRTILEPLPPWRSLQS